MLSSIYIQNKQIYFERNRYSRISETNGSSAELPPKKQHRYCYICTPDAALPFGAFNLLVLLSRFRSNEVLVWWFRSFAYLYTPFYYSFKDDTLFGYNVLNKLSINKYERKIDYFFKQLLNQTVFHQFLHLEHLSNLGNYLIIFEKFQSSPVLSSFNIIISILSPP